MSTREMLYELHVRTTGEFKKHLNFEKEDF